MLVQVGAALSPSPSDTVWIYASSERGLNALTSELKQLQDFFVLQGNKYSILAARLS